MQTQQQHCCGPAELARRPLLRWQTSQQHTATCRMCRHTASKAQHRVPASSCQQASANRLSPALNAAAGAAVAALLLISQPASAAETAAPLQEAQEDTEGFLFSTGGRGPLAQEEARLLRLRREKEEEATAELRRQRELFEGEVARSQRDRSQLCATPFGVDVVGITEFVALTGALVGGFSARQRKVELERLNEQLRKINLGLRQQARAGTVYAPGLTYAPPPSQAGSLLQNSSPAPDAASALAATAALAPPAPGGIANGVLQPVQEVAEAVEQVIKPPPFVDAAATSSVMASMDEDDMTAEARQCLHALKEGKRLLKASSGASAMVRFEKALMLARYTQDRVQQRRAVRGLAAAARLQGQHRTAIDHLKTVLRLSDEMDDHVGDADAYGTIADIFTDIGEFEKAASYYDKFIERMSSDGPV